MKILKLFLLSFVCISCDLRPKILSVQDNVGDFISDKYPALLADPDTEPEIYNSAVLDYGLYNSVDLYGENQDTLIYSSILDYELEEAKKDIIKENNFNKINNEEHTIKIKEEIAQTNAEDFIIVKKGDTLYNLSKKYNIPADEILKINDLKTSDIKIGQKILLKKKEQEFEKIKQDVYNEEYDFITIKKGDTLYSIEKKYKIDNKKLSEINNLPLPILLKSEQIIKVPDIKIEIIDTKTDNKKDVKINDNKKKSIIKNENKKEKNKISSNPYKKLPKLKSRSGTKFSWPLKGKIISTFGSKPDGLYNDGININGKIGMPVLSAENGVVAYAGNEVKGMGNLIIMQHSDGWMTVYAHLDTMDYKRGAEIKVGQKIGTVGQTGKVNSPQLHFEIRKGVKSYNPLNHLKK